MKLTQILAAACGLALAGTAPALAQITPSSPGTVVTPGVPGTTVPQSAGTPGTVTNGGINSGTIGRGTINGTAPGGTIQNSTTPGSIGNGTVYDQGTVRPNGMSVPATGPGGTRRVRRAAPTTTTPVRP